MRKGIGTILSTVALTLCVTANAQNVKDLVRQAGACHDSWDFAGAISLYESALKLTDDPATREAINESKMRSENGLNLLQYAATPVVKDRKTVPLKDFMLRYGHLSDKKWVKLPNDLSGDAVHKFNTAVYFDAESPRGVFYSAPGEGGAWNIYTTRPEGDGQWSAPQLVRDEKDMTTTGDEVLPLLSADGKSLYFSSNGMQGIGGYDLFVSRWDDATSSWGAPQNLGFPFSSPADDFLYCDTPDGNFTIFASNRDCSADSITIYVLAFENQPVRRELTSLKTIRDIARLSPAAEEEDDDNVEENARNDEPTDPRYRRYVALAEKQEALRDEIESLRIDLAAARRDYASASESGRKELAETIRRGEEKEFALQRQLSANITETSSVAENLIAAGIMPETTAPRHKEPETVPTTDEPRYEFSLHGYGKLPAMKMEEQEEAFDYRFRILDKAVIVDDNTLPGGIIYQIQLCVVSNKMSIAKLKGLCPVYEKRQGSGKYLYAVGRFTTFSEAQSNLQKVRNVGFKDAIVIAFNNGRSIGLSKAKELEKSSAGGATYRVVLSGFSSGIPSGVLSLISSRCSKEIVKSVKDNEIVYIIAPFHGRLEADELCEALRSEGVEGVSVEQINN